MAAYYAWLFPNLMFNVYPWGLSVNVVQPLSRLYSKGRYSPQHERGTHHFHRLVGACLGA